MDEPENEASSPSEKLKSNSKSIPYVRRTINVTCISVKNSNMKINKHPDPKKHLIASLIKSLVRLLGYFTLWYDIGIAATLLVLSEMIGIGEELV